jgi:DNA mismatch endonuclease (patch repair protein)
MSRVRQKDTGPELVVRKILYSRGWRYRLHARDLPGRPDIVFRGRKAAIFVHGCFWHGHKGCKLATVPKTRTEFWCNKIEANRTRDIAAVEQLEGLGWKVLTVWQCELRDPAQVALRLENFLGATPTIAKQ